MRRSAPNAAAASLCFALPYVATKATTSVAKETASAPSTSTTPARAGRRPSQRGASPGGQLVGAVGRRSPPRPDEQEPHGEKGEPDPERDRSQQHVEGEAERRAL